jgi:hypothetical protein
MKRYLFILTVCTVVLVLFTQIGCQRQAGPARDGGAVARNGAKKGPRIAFKRTVHDFGDVNPGATLSCDFKFTNTGDEVLKVEQPESTCPCTIGRLTKTEYAPGESGVVKVTEFRVPKDEGTTTQHLIVPSNDRTKQTARLAVKANVMLRIAFSPKKLRILLRDENTECPEIELISIVGEPFGIKNVRATTKKITADYDASVIAKKHIIRPKIDTKGFHRRTEGSIEIEVTHPGQKKVIVPFTLVPEFHIKPHIIVLFNAEPGKPMKKALALANSVGEDFEVEWVSSEEKLISVLSQEKVENVYEFELEITPPADTSESRFGDVLYISLKGGKRLEVRCTGFYKKAEITSESGTE